GSEQYNQPPYVWEGYNVYQGASIAGPWTRIATYDRVDGITAVTDIECDPASPIALPKVKAFGTDAGVKYSIDLSDDRVRGGPSHAGTAYDSTVTPYSVGVGQFQQVLESPFTPITVVPQTPAAGVDPSVAGVGPIDHALAAGAPPATPLSTDVVAVNVLDAA